MQQVIACLSQYVHAVLVIARVCSETGEFWTT